MFDILALLDIGPSTHTFCDVNLRNCKCSINFFVALLFSGRGYTASKQHFALSISNKVVIR